MTGNDKASQSVIVNVVEQFMQLVDRLIGLSVGKLCLEMSQSVSLTVSIGAIDAVVNRERFHLEGEIAQLALESGNSILKCVELE